MQKRFGEFKCPYPKCDFMCHDQKVLHGHIGGAHKRNITKDKVPHCKFCNERLIEGKNWAQWAIKQRNLICVMCKRKQNRKSYRNRKSIAIKKRTNKLVSLKERLHGRHS